MNPFNVIEDDASEAMIEEEEENEEEELNCTIEEEFRLILEDVDHDMDWVTDTFVKDSGDDETEESLQRSYEQCKVEAKIRAVALRKCLKQKQHLEDKMGLKSVTEQDRGVLMAHNKRLATDLEGMRYFNGCIAISNQDLRAKLNSLELEKEGLHITVGKLWSNKCKLDEEITSLQGQLSKDKH